MVSTPNNQVTGGVLRSFLHFCIHADQGLSQYMVSHVTVVITQVSRHIHSVHLSTIHTCEVMDGLVHEAGREKCFHT